ncbi:head-tail adaptor protein [Clostridium niameyense]|uniref:Head-tail adaptor protein n=2 Tax=Clostridium niameyense TaxID=1622073 RepID=A0A6M0RCE5_9CLOT|nr:head-tail adaptor protein [Clostridium niameyense]
MLSKKQTMNNLALTFNKRISILEFKDMENEVGDIEQRLVEIKKVYAFITSLAKGKEYIENKKIQQKLIYKIILRTNLEINQSMFIRYKNKLFNIKDILDINFPFITLFVEEKKTEQEQYNE